MLKRTEPEDGRSDFNPVAEEPTSAAKIRKIESQDANHEQPNTSITHSSLRADETARMDSSDSEVQDERSRNFNRSPREQSAPEQKPPEQQPAGGENNKQRHAMDFLVKVKSHYAENPTVYNQFLEIMKDFKSARIDTPDVIDKVKELFYGHNNLILEFNSFLPPGYRIDVDPEPVVPTPPVAGVGPNQPTTQADLEHARNYVRKIKNRFALQPQIYKHFLEILHCYYQGQFLINEVLGEVGELFASHADLLEEFKLFLPRAVADPATNAKKNKPTKKEVSAPPPPPPKRTTTERRKPATEVEMLTMSMPERRRLPEREKRPNFEDKKREDISLPIRRIPRPPFVNPVQEYGYYTEKSFFHAVRERLGNNMLYQEFLKTIDLLSQEMISKSELLALVKELLIEHKDLFKSFKNFIGIKGEEKDEGENEKEEEQDKENSSSSSSDEENEENGKKKNKKKSKLEYEIITLTPEQEERYQLDLFLDLNQATMRALDQLLDASYVTNTPPLPETLDVLHIRNIERVYGDRSNELIEALFVNPLAAIPVIQKRLRQKNQEWASAKKLLASKVAEDNVSSTSNANEPVTVAV